MMSVIIVLLSLYEMKQRATHRESFFKGITKLSRSHWGMILAHLGVAMTVWGIAFSQNFSVEAMCEWPLAILCRSLTMTSHLPV